MQTLSGFNFFPLHLDENGAATTPAEIDAFCAAAKSVSDTLVIAHGFRNAESDATGLYTEFLSTLGTNMLRPEFAARLAGRTYAVAGVYWPSLAFNETPGTGTEGTIQDLVDPLAGIKDRLIEMKATLAKPGDGPTLDKAIALLPQLDGDPDAQDHFVKLVLSIVDQSQLEAMEGLERLKTTAGADVLSNAGKAGAAAAASQDGDDDQGGVMSLDDTGGVQSFASFFDGIAGKVDQFLNFTTWYIMRARSGTVGANGISSAVRALQLNAPNAKIHLIGHSLGGRSMASCARALSQSPLLKCDSLILLEAAFSQYGFSPDNGKGQVGFFRAVIDQQIVKGPIMATFSAQDTVVGTVYALASRLAGQNVDAVGDASDEFGGIGRNGSLKTPESASQVFHTAGAHYADFAAGRIMSLDGSNGFIKDHSDIRNANVTYAVATTLALT